MAKKSKSKKNKAVKVASSSPESPPKEKINTRSSFYCWDGDVLIVNILGTPSARKDAIGKVKGDQLCVSVSAVPRAGRATDYMVKFLAPEFGVKPAAIEVVFGRTNINKQIRIHAPQKLPAVIQRHEDKRKKKA